MLEELIREKPIVFVIDDERSIRTSLKFLLEDEYNLVLCKTRAETVEQYQKIVPDALIVDLHLDTARKDGLDLIQELNKIDPFPTKIIFTAYADAESAMKGYDLGVSGYVSKPNTVELKNQVPIAVKKTAENRKKLLYEFREHYQKFSISVEESDKTGPIEVERNFGLWLKTVYHRFPLREGSYFTVDSQEGVNPVGIADFKKQYSENFRFYVVKKYKSLEYFDNIVENWRLCIENGIKHVEPVFYYQDEGQVYALNRMLFAPNFAYIFNQLNSSEDGKRALRLKEAIIKVNIDVLAKFQNLNQGTHQLSVEEINKIKSDYLKNIETSLRQLREKTSSNFEDSELESLLISLDGLEAIFPYKDEGVNKILFSRLMDNSLENSGLVLESLKPDIQKIYGMLLKYEDNEEDLLQALREKYVIIDSHSKFGPRIEDFVHFAHGQEAELNSKQKIDAFKYFVDKSFKISEIDPDLLWMSNVKTGVYKAIRKQNLILTVYSENNKKDLEHFKITREEYERKAKDYNKKILHWGNEAAWFATLGYLIVDYNKQGKQKFFEINNILKQPNIIEETQKGLNDMSIPENITKMSSPSDKMLYLYKFFDACMPKLESSTANIR